MRLWFVSWSSWKVVRHWLICCSPDAPGFLQALWGHGSVWSLQNSCARVHELLPRFGERIQGHSLWVELYFYFFLLFFFWVLKRSLAILQYLLLPQDGCIALDRRQGRRLHQLAFRFMFPSLTVSRNISFSRWLNCLSLSYQLQCWCHFLFDLSDGQRERFLGERNWKCAFIILKAGFLSFELRTIICR